MPCFRSTGTGLDIMHHLGLLRKICSSLCVTVVLLFSSFPELLETAAIHESSLWRMQWPWLKSELQDWVLDWKGEGKRRWDVWNALMPSLCFSVDEYIAIAKEKHGYNMEQVTTLWILTLFQNLFQQVLKRDLKWLPKTGSSLLYCLCFLLSYFSPNWLLLIVTCALGVWSSSLVLHQESKEEQPL